MRGGEELGLGWCLWGEPGILGPGEPHGQGFWYLLFATRGRCSEVLQEVMCLSYTFKRSLWLQHGVSMGAAGRGLRDQGGGSCQVQARNELMASGCALCAPIFWISPWNHPVVNTPKRLVVGSQSPGGCPLHTPPTPIILAKPSADLSKNRRFSSCINLLKCPEEEKASLLTFSKSCRVCECVCV